MRTSSPRTSAHPPPPPPRWGIWSLLLSLLPCTPPSQVGLRVDEAFAKMSFLHGFVHADPHPGNIMVRACGRRGLLSWLLRGSWQPFEVVLLDHGVYLDMPEQLRERYCQLWWVAGRGE
jgi:aarF domain-containing kinase